jgi:hypothetical protein
VQPHLRGRCAPWRRAVARFELQRVPARSGRLRPAASRALVFDCSGARALAAAIASNATLTRLELKYNMFGFDGAKALLEVALHCDARVPRAYRAAYFTLLQQSTACLLWHAATLCNNKHAVLCCNMQMLPNSASLAWLRSYVRLPVVMCVTVRARMCSSQVLCAAVQQCRNGQRRNALLHRIRSQALGSNHAITHLGLEGTTARVCNSDDFDSNAQACLRPFTTIQRTMQPTVLMACSALLAASEQGDAALSYCESKTVSGCLLGHH